VDGQKDVRTFETHFIRSTLSKSSRPNNTLMVNNVSNNVSQALQSFVGMHLHGMDVQCFQLCMVFTRVTLCYEHLVQITCNQN